MSAPNDAPVEWSKAYVDAERDELQSESAAEDTFHVPPAGTEELPKATKKSTTSSHNLNESYPQPEEQSQSKVPSEPPAQMEHPVEEHQTFREIVHSSTALTAVKLLALSYFRIIVVYLGVLSLYWGSNYRREYRFKNMNYLVVSEDVPVTLSPNVTLPAYINDAITDMTIWDPEVISLGSFELASLTYFNAQAEKANRTAREQAVHEVYLGRYWGLLYIHKNATLRLYDALVYQNVSFLADVGLMVEFVYSSGRHFSALNQYVVRNLHLLNQIWVQNYTSSQVYEPLVQNHLNSTTKINLLSSNNTMALLLAKPSINFVDISPSQTPSVLGPAELGLIYAFLFSFYQFAFTTKMHQIFLAKLKWNNFVIYRLSATASNCLILSLVYLLISIAFQVNYQYTFGRAGFMVLWCIMFLYMWACALQSEIVVSIIYMSGKLWLTPIYVIFAICWNISPTFNPFVLLPGFYRYGYGLLLMYNAYELLKIVFFNTERLSMGRNFGVLLGFIGLLLAVLISLTYYVKEQIKKKSAI